MFMRRLMYPMYLFAPDEPGGGAAPAPADTAPVEPTTPEGGGETPTTEEIDWQKRAEDAQAWGTRASQEAAEYRDRWEKVQSDDEAFAELARERGFEVELPSIELPDDPTEALAAKVAALEADLSRRDQQAQADQELQERIAHTEASLAAINSELGASNELDADDVEAIVSLAAARWRANGEQGMPDVLGAHKAFVSRDEKAMARWAKTKRPTHRVSANGTEATQVPDTTTHDARVALMVEQLTDPA